MFGLLWTSLGSIHSWFKQPSSLVVLGDYKHVGVRDIRLKNGVECRVFYPASPSPSSAPVSVFTHGFLSTVEGYIHSFSNYRYPSYSLMLIKNIVFGWLSLSPVANATIPYCGRDAPPAASNRKFPIVIWSHGLFGTNEEHALLFTSLASHGYVIAAIHHTDGSSSKSFCFDAPIFYDHPNFDESYDPEFRFNQIQRREGELFEMEQEIMSGSSELPSSVMELIDTSQIFVGGFSYGAATSALAVAKRPKHYKAAILLDGWFSIDYTLLKNFKHLGHRDFPPLAFEVGLSCPSLFIGTQQFSEMKELRHATERLQNKCPIKQEYIIPGTKHQNVCDVLSWFPVGTLQRRGAIGIAEPYEALRSVTRDCILPFLASNRSTN